VIELGRTAITGTPVRTFEVTVIEPPKMLCSTLPSALTATASVSTPLPSLIASRAAISLFSGVEDTSAAAGVACAATAASASAFGATRY
jgi:hypothetical protein